VLPVSTRDGRSLHVEVAGRGEPTVVLEAGMGASRHMWGAVAPAVAERVRTVTYDRSGLGRSPADEATRGLDRLADDLIDVLGHLGTGPLVLVGHSWGGPIVRVAAARAPERIAGIVLVDPSDEGCAPMLTEANEKRARSSAWMLPLMARFGLLRLYARRLAGRLPEPARSGMRSEDATRAATRTHVAEVIGSIADLRRLHDEPPAEPDVPLTIISGTQASRMEGPHRPALVAAHQARVAAATDGRHVLAERSGHMVPFTEPDLVAAEIVRLVTSLAGTPEP
jgi:pimeloyl-ACP methyl ester carboxylesterase